MNKKVLNSRLFGHGLLTTREPPSKSTLNERFGFAPFSVLNTREGTWQDRRRRWLGLGLQSELGRDSKVYHTGEWVRKHQKLGTLTSEPAGERTDISVFDPVLCELCYAWFCPAGGQILDPFAGGSVRGIVAATCGYRYWGCDLSKRQIAANSFQAQSIVPGNPPAWVCGDSEDQIQQAPQADFLFSCPPYGNLEVYSAHENDLSNMDYTKFLVKYRSIVRHSANRLRQNRFACFVVANYRDGEIVRNLVGDTITAFASAGLEFYNDLVLVNAAGSAPIRATNQFRASRKAVKLHQNVLVFIKGSARKAAAIIEKGNADTQS